MFKEIYDAAYVSQKFHFATRSNITKVQMIRNIFNSRASNTKRDANQIKLFRRIK